MTACRDCGADVVDHAHALLAEAERMAERMGDPITLCLECYKRTRGNIAAATAWNPPPYQDREPGEDG